MARKQTLFKCSVVNETVSIRLKNRRVGGFSGDELPFVQCDQTDCQYADENKLPCPLSPALFPDELEKRKQRAVMRRESQY